LHSFFRVFFAAIFQRPIVSRANPLFASPVSPGLGKQPQSSLPDPKDRTIGALAFVNRDKEALQIAFVNIINKITQQHRTLPSTGQLFGSGKTEMGQHTVARVLVSDELQQKLLEECGKGRTDLVKDYVNAVTVSVSFMDYEPSGNTTLTHFLTFALYNSIRLGAETKDLKIGNTDKSLAESWPKIEEKDFPSVFPNLASVCDKFIKETGRSLFIHWDEV
jgi:hypothetical protein